MSNETIFIGAGGEGMVRVKPTPKPEEAMKDFLSSFGVLDMQDTNLIDTPTRVSKMYREELLAGYSMEEPNLTTFPTPEVGSQQVTVHGIDVSSTCSHHLMPISGSASVSCYFIPDQNGDTWLPGLSKYARVVELFSRRLQLQERLSHQIAKYLLDNTHAVWVGVHINAEHYCMKHRGVRLHESDTTTTTFLRKKYYHPNDNKYGYTVEDKDNGYFITHNRSEELISTFLADVRARGCK